MAINFKRVDIRGLSPQTATKKLEKSLLERKKYEPIWLIDDKEPIDCYAYLIQENYLFQTFIMSSREYRVFVGCGYY
ncbi:MAG: hypothetical protein CMP61_07910 [Flavobacteriales bacterium]|nr:hypothetical protein [Flavobacteriales bacterium]|tara:strand:- start:2719 stop:2949 length:231 start_codon:yes stop_codon:yes gene_type:complete